MPKMRRKSDLPTKICAACGLPFAWRKKWERDWDNVRYCSGRCRGKGKAGMMCGKAGMAMNHAKAGKAGGCCCDGMGGANMSRRT